MAYNVGVFIPYAFSPMIGMVSKVCAVRSAMLTLTMMMEMQQDARNDRKLKERRQRGSFGLVGVYAVEVDWFQGLDASQECARM